MGDDIFDVLNVAMSGFGQQWNQALQNSQQQLSTQNYQAQAAYWAQRVPGQFLAQSPAPAVVTMPAKATDVPEIAWLKQRIDEVSWK